MKRSLISILPRNPAWVAFLIISTAVFFSSCGKPELASGPKEKTGEEPNRVVFLEAETSSSAVAEERQEQFPYSATISNQSGKQLVGQILAKDGDEVAFRRESDQKLFVIPISTLSQDTQVMLSQFHDENVEKLAAAKVPATTVASTAPTPARRPLGAEYDANFSTAIERAASNGKDVMIIALGKSGSPVGGGFDPLGKDSRYLPNKGSTLSSGTGRSSSGGDCPPGGT